MTGVLNIAHRGARSLAPENTILAARKGLEIGADLWELDVAATADGELVVLHDDTLARTSNVAAVFPSRQPWAIHTFTLAELRQLDFGSWYLQTDPFGQIAAGAVSAADQAAFPGLSIPTLRDALEFTRANHWRVNIEIKDMSGTPGDAFIAEKVVALVGNMQMDNAVMISSFNHSYIIRVKQTNPALITAVLVEEACADPLELLRRTGASAYNPGLEILEFDHIAPLRRAGYDVFVWTVNEEADMRRLITAGVSGLFTDFPQRLKKVLASL